MAGAGSAEGSTMTEKRPSWRDILWTPIYDFVHSRWGTRGLRWFAISIALVVVAVARWGLGKGVGVMVRGAAWVARKAQL